MEKRNPMEDRPFSETLKLHVSEAEFKNSISEILCMEENKGRKDGARVMTVRLGRPTRGLHFEIVLPEKRISEVKDFEIAFLISFLFFSVRELHYSITYSTASNPAKKRSRRYQFLYTLRFFFLFKKKIGNLQKMPPTKKLELKI